MSTGSKVRHAFSNVFAFLFWSRTGNWSYYRLVQPDWIYALCPRCLAGRIARSGFAPVNARRSCVNPPNSAFASASSAAFGPRALPANCSHCASFSRHC